MFTAAALKSEQPNQNADFSRRPETEAGHAETPMRRWKLPAIIFCLLIMPVEWTMTISWWFPVHPAVLAWAEPPRLSHSDGRQPGCLQRQCWTQHWVYHCPWQEPGFPARGAERDVVSCSNPSPGWVIRRRLNLQCDPASGCWRLLKRLWRWSLMS